jgi:predicted nucleic acid-binding protein
MAASAKSVVVDAGFWYALFDSRDYLHPEADAKAAHIDSLTVVFPWPTLYETLGTRFVKNRLGVDGLSRMLRRPNVRFIDDAAYREAALDATLREAGLGKRAISLCDMMIRLMIEDINVRIDAILTFNHKDFSDVCRSARVEIL